MKIRMFVIFAAVMLAAAAQPQSAQTDLQKLQGVWKTAELNYNGKNLTEKLSFRFVFKGEQVVVEGNDAVKKEYARLTFKLNPAANPKIVDITVGDGVQKGVVIEGIYELKDGTLKLCAKVFGKDRPSEFAAPDGSSTVLLVMKRESP